MSPEDDDSSDTEDEIEVVSPDPLAGAESDPGKKIIDKEGVTAINHLDAKNSMNMAYLDRINNRVREVHREVLEDLQSQNQSNDPGLRTTFEESSRVIEIHALILTYFEGVAFQFLKWAWEADHEFIEHVEEVNEYVQDRDEPPHEWDREAVKSFNHRMNARQWINIFKDVGFYTENLGALHDVKDRRNAYIHNPEQALDIRARQDAYPGRATVEHHNWNFSDEFVENLKDQAPNETAGEVLNDCITALNGIEMMVEKHLPMNSEFYDAMTPDDDWL